jgi:ADP-dependent NAD(P)H-hydrate dehydratase
MDVEPICEVPRLSQRKADGHKGTYGTVLVVAGSRGMTGAAILVGRGALRSGAGLVRVASPACIQDVVAGGYPCYTTIGIRQHTDGSFAEGAAAELVELAKAVDVVALGPGLGQGASVSGFVRTLIDGLPNVPLVIDADGLNAIAPLDGGFTKRSASVVLTPHPGEFARLLGRPVHDVVVDRESLVLEFANRAGAIVLLKGSGTLVTDSRKLYRNTTGNPGMATGGSGDVLTGVIAALISQGLAAFDAAVLGAWAHGRAGDIAAMKLGQVGLNAADLVEYLPAALREQVSV